MSDETFVQDTVADLTYAQTKKKILDAVFKKVETKRMDHRYPVTTTRLGVRKIIVSGADYVPAETQADPSNRLTGISHDHEVPHLKINKIVMAVDDSVRGN